MQGAPRGGGNQKPARSHDTTCKTAPVQEAAAGREACGGDGMRGGGPTERGEGPSPKTQQQMVIKKKKNNEESSATPRIEEGAAAPRRVSPAAKQVPISTGVIAKENHEHPLPQKAKSRRLAGRERGCTAAGEFKVQRKAVRSSTTI